ncbi:MAG: 3-hydroxyacyl-CoA dehydrogenase family protein [Chloroflexi bacterium]|nr:MAG: 3-hydroxyacyl-CoA dehydrogenase family protein [Chloroflexota bacterium]
MSDERLLVLGAGTMGSQIAQQAALCGVEVDLVDISTDQLARAVEQNRRLLESRVTKGRLEAADAEAALARVTTSDDLPASASRCDWAVEAVLEQLEPKRTAFAELDRHLPAHAGIATNSSNIVSSRLADATSRPELCCNMHFFHPVLVMDVCEVVRGPHTSEETARRAVEWSRRMGRAPVLIEKEIDGFVVNRILGAASREAFSLLAAGVASPADIDAAARLGLNWRMGPFQLADFSGLDTVHDVRRDRYEKSGAPGDLETVEVLAQLIAEGRRGRKSGRGFYDYSTDPPSPLPVPGID